MPTYPTSRSTTSLPFWITWESAVSCSCECGDVIDGVDVGDHDVAVGARLQDADSALEVTELCVDGPHRPEHVDRRLHPGADGELFVLAGLRLTDQVGAEAERDAGTVRSLE